MSTPTPQPVAVWPFGPPTPAQIDADVKAVGAQVTALATQVTQLQQAVAALPTLAQIQAAISTAVAPLATTAQLNAATVALPDLPQEIVKLQDRVVTIMRELADVQAGVINVQHLVSPPQ